VILRNLVIIAAAALPCLILFRFVDRFDSQRPESRRLIAKLFVGGMAAAVAAIVAELILVPLAGFAPPAYAVPARAVLAIALPEEALKLTALVLIVRYRRDFDEILDGAVFGTTAAMGFALVENIIYVFGAPDPMATALVRGLTAVPLHALAGGFMGLAVARDRIASRGGIGIALLIAVAIHGLYDVFLMDPRVPGILIAPLLIVGWILLVLDLRRAREDDRRAGRIPPIEPG